MKQLGKMAGYWVIAGTFVLLLLAGCGTYDGNSGSGTERGGAARVGNTDTFQVGDLVTVTFSGPSELIPEHSETIKEDGNITLPLIGAVEAAGRTAGQLQNEIREKYSKFYRNLTVSVKSDSRFFFVDGEVKAAGRQVYIGQITVLKAIQSTGGFTDFANKKKVLLTRAGSNKPIIVNCDKALKNPELDLPVYPGDSIHVKRSIF